jgi:hypothetical protein
MAATVLMVVTVTALIITRIATPLLITGTNRLVGKRSEGRDRGYQDGYEASRSGRY